MKAAFFLLALAIFAGCVEARPTSDPFCVFGIVNCFVDPCQVAHCHTHPEYTCRSNYCGGCNAVWYDQNNQVQSCVA